MNLRDHLISRERLTLLNQRMRQEQQRQDQTLARQACCRISLAGPGAEARMGDVIVLVMTRRMVVFTVACAGDGEDTEKEICRHQEHGTARAWRFH